MLNLTRFRVITFDCYGTLIDWEAGIFSEMRPILSAHSKQIADAEILKHYSELEAEAEGGEYRPYWQVLEFVVRGFGERLGFRPDNTEVASLPDSVAHWRPFPDTISALHKLRSKFRLAVISNIDDHMFAASARHLGVAFDEVITAQQAHAYKPSLEIFKLAERKIGANCQQWLHVGQSIYHDVIPAQSLGIATVWVNRASPRPGSGAAKAASGKPDLEVPDMSTLALLATG
jgi:2-haloacid dehalogenase